MPGSKTHPITIRVSTSMLLQIDHRRGAVSRERFIMDAVEACFAKLDAPKRPEVTKAIAANTDLLKTGRYEP